MKDTQWIVNECVGYEEPVSLNVHRLLVELAKRICEKRGVDDPLWLRRVRNAESVLEVVRKSVPREEEALRIYLARRRDSILDFAFAMAEVGARRWVWTCRRRSSGC